MVKIKLFNIWIKKRFECLFRFCNRYPIDENEESKRILIKTARLKEVFQCA
ncbi:hypothetical protein [Helicobacter pylori]|uniref:hypothetical protein n=1 Tax=Helicobacter pylori TaxID=210 RepID=UPI0018A7B52F|nr:hypothetical protein [Helicobacter pylori]